MNSLDAWMNDSEVCAVLVVKISDDFNFKIVQGVLPSGVHFESDINRSCLRVDAEVVVQKPITLIWDFQVKAYAREFKILLGKFASLKLNEVWIEAQSAQIESVRLNHRIELQDTASLEWTWFEDISQSAQIEFDQKISADANSQLKTSTASLGGGKVTFKSETLVAGPGVNISSVGGLRGRGNQILDFYQKNDHVSPSSTSSMDLYTVMTDESRATFSAMIRIPQTGVKTEATQRNKNLLLSKKSSVQTLPQLEIETDDVKCAHGASISQVDPSQLYYLQSRGINAQDAEAMIVNGFTAPVVQRFLTNQQRAQVQMAFSGVKDFTVGEFDAF